VARKRIQQRRFYPPSELDPEIMEAVRRGDLDQAMRIDHVSRYAEWGDWTPLAEYIGTGGALTKKMRAFVARVLRGEEKRPPNKTVSRAKDWEYLRWGLFVAAVEAARGVTRAAAIDKAAEAFGVDRRTIYDGIKMFAEFRLPSSEEKNPPWLQRVCQLLVEGKQEAALVVIDEEFSSIFSDTK
jgi:hypothetical protein